MGMIKMDMTNENLISITLPTVVNQNWQFHTSHVPQQSLPFYKLLSYLHKKLGKATGAM